MSAKNRANHFLSRVTGYHLVPGRPGEAEARRARARARDAEIIARQRRRLRRQRQQIERDQRQAEKQRRLIESLEQRTRGVPRDIDDAARQTIDAVRPWTMTGVDKLYDLVQSVRYVCRHEVAGDIVECGVWRGGSMQAVALTLLEVGDTTRELHLFDTFEGMPPPTDKDRRIDGRPAAELLAASDRSDELWAHATLDDVRAGLAAVPYPAEKIHFVPGKVEDTIPEHTPERIAILRLDTDWYESTDHELRHMYDHLSPGGVLLLDDYGHWEGARKATDEFLERTGEPLLLLRMGVGRIAVKPWR